MVFLSHTQISSDLHGSLKMTIRLFQVIDDTLFEGMEEFEVSISSPSEPGKLGPLIRTTVIIAGPNDGKGRDVSF